MTELTDHHKFLLMKGLARADKIGEEKYKNAYVSYDEAVELYANKETAASALMSLRVRGFIETTKIPGILKIINAPPELHKRADLMRKTRKYD